MIVADGITATLIGSPDIDLGRAAGTAALDESWSPHVRASLTISLPDEATLDALDPRDARRIRIAASATYPGSFIPDASRTFNLGLRSRVIDEESAEVRLELESDEALLMDDVWLGPAANTTALAYQDSLRSIINEVVLDRIGAALEPGSTDAPFRVLWNSTNFATNPSLETGAASWATGTGSTGGTLVTTPAPPPGRGAQCLRWTASGAGASLIDLHGVTGLPVTAGEKYSVGIDVRSSVARPIRILIRFKNAGGATVADVWSVAANSSTSAWTRFLHSAIAPVGATQASVHVEANPNTTGQFHYADGFTFVQGEDAGYFDGNTTDSTEYAYQWTGIANASTSTRTALIDRSPDLLNWDAGVSAWDFIQPLFQAVGFRLFCDEQRRWFLVDGSTFVAPGALQLTMPGNLHSATDTTDRGADTWFDAAVARYRWRDSNAVPQEAIDSYAAPGYTKVQLFDIEAAYPGPGFAAYAVKRAEGRGRTVALEAVSNLDVQPSQVLTVILPDAPTLIGVVRSVSYDFADGRMTIASRGITDIPDGAWVLAAPGLTWAAAPAAVVWNNWINPGGM